MNEESIVLVGDLGERALTLPEKAKIGKAVREQKETCHIPGVKTWVVKTPIQR